MRELGTSALIFFSPIWLGALIGLAIGLAA
jgi:hypothetical protein